MPNVRVKASVRRQTEQRLRRLARAATVFIDGEAFKAIPLRPELNTGDDYAVDHDRFIAVKRTLLKLKRIEDGDVGVTTWRPWAGGSAQAAPAPAIEDAEQMEQVCPVDMHELTVRPGNHPVSAAVASAFRGQTAVQQIQIRGFPVLSICAPIRDSLEDVVGAVELFASLAPDQFKVDMLDY